MNNDVIQRLFDLKFRQATLELMIEKYNSDALLGKVFGIDVALVVSSLELWIKEIDAEVIQIAAEIAKEYYIPIIEKYLVNLEESATDTARKALLKQEGECAE